VDEIQHDLAMEKHSPASRYLSGQIVDSDHRCKLLRELDSLEVSSDRWLPDNMMQAVMPAVHLTSELGIRYKYVPSLVAVNLTVLSQDRLPKYT
jgi:hypothetical protein